MSAVKTSSAPLSFPELWQQPSSLPEQPKYRYIFCETNTLCFKTCSSEGTLWLLKGRHLTVRGRTQGRKWTCCPWSSCIWHTSLWGLEQTSHTNKIRCCHGLQFFLNPSHIQDVMAVSTNNKQFGTSEVTSDLKPFSKATTSNPTESAWLYSWFCTIKLYRISCTTWFCTVQWKSSFSLVRTFLAAKAGTQLWFKGSIITSWFFKACFVSLNYLDISSYYFLMELTEEATTVEK